MAERSSDSETLSAGLAMALRRVGLGKPTGLERLTGGATMESWRFTSDGEGFVLRRAPTDNFMDDRPFGHDVEAQIIRAANRAGVRAPDIVAELSPADGIGSGFVMRVLPGTPDPRAILVMDDPDRLLVQIAQDCARIHTIGANDLPEAVPTLDYESGVGELRKQFLDAGGDRPILALGLRWLQANLPKPVEPVLNHGDYRLGNLLVEGGQLTGVLDWELAHFGDFHEDLAFGCMAVWRFARYDRPALGLGSLETYFTAYETASGRRVDRKRFRFWTIYRTVWWALGCLKMAAIWRSGEDRMLERVVISRRTSEQEMDLLMLLEEDAPTAIRRETIVAPRAATDANGEADLGEIAQAISEWLGTIKGRMEGHDRFQLAVARNALGMIAREHRSTMGASQPAILRDMFDGEADPLLNAEMLGVLRYLALDKVMADSPKYPALAVALKKWTGDN